MTEVKSAAHFNEIIKAFRAGHGKLLSNCYLMTDEIEELAKSGRLFVAEYRDWLFIISDSSDYSNIYYYTVEDSDPETARLLLSETGDRNLFIDVVTKNGRGDTQTPEKLIRAGFASPYKKYIRLQQLTREMDLEKYTPVLADGYYWANDYSNYDEALRLWKSSLDDKSTPLPTKESFLRHKKDGSILFVVDGKNDLAAVYLVSISGNQSLLQHLAVSPDHRRKHLGDTLICKSFHYCRDRGVKKFLFWAFAENTPILNLMKHYGFTEDGTLCDQLIVNK